MTTFQDSADHPFDTLSSAAYEGQGSLLSTWVEDAEESVGDIVNEEEQKFWSLGWSNGYNSILNAELEPDGERKLCGLYLPTSVGIKTTVKMPLELKKAMDKLVKEKKAVLLNVKHDDGSIKSYYQFVDGAYKMYPLFIGLPLIGKTNSAIIPNDCYRIGGPNPQSENLLGVVVGRETNVDRERKKQSTNNFIACLFVIDCLWEAGYVDPSTGLPIPLKFKGTAFGKDELANVLRKHNHVAIMARGHNKEKYGTAEPYQFALVLHHENKRIDHVSAKTGKKSEAFRVAAQMPEVLNMDYIESMYCKNPAQRLALKRLVKEQREINGKIVTVPGGVAIRWCRDEAVKNVNQQRYWNPVSDRFASGEAEYGKNKELTPRMTKLLIQTAQAQEAVEEPQDRAPRRAPVQVQPAQPQEEEVDLYSIAIDLGAKLSERSDIPEAEEVMTELEACMTDLSNGAPDAERAMRSTITKAQNLLNPPRKPFSGSFRRPAR